MISQTISHYKILEKLGGGGMGVVYKAEDTKLHRMVALKFLPPELTRNKEAKQRFIQEAQAASSLDHNNICVVHEIDETDDGQLFICMNYYDGKTLKEKIERGPLNLDDAIDITIQIAQGLLKAHEQKIIHRDIKPANIFITNDGVVKILDFGLAKLSGKTMITKIGSTLGTIAYMSPEQTRGEEVDNRTDIWSLGVVIYEMLTGLSPFKGEYEQALFYSIITEDPSPITGLRTGIPLELERIVFKALAKKPDERYQHIDEMIVDLKKLIKDSEKETVKSIKSVTIQEKTFFKKYKKYLIATVILIIAGIVFLMLKPFLFEDVLVSKPMPIAVITFENQTGNDSYDYLQKAIPNLLITNLEQTKFFRVTTWERMQDLLNQMGKSNIKVIDEKLGFDICRREGVDVIVIGSYIKAGNIFATDIKVLDVATKHIIKSVSAKGEGVSSILVSQIDELSKEISQSIGISYSKITAAKMKIIDVTTNSMEAYNYFLNGRDNYDKFYFTEARENLEMAVKIDSTFASAYLELARTYSSLQETKNRNDALQKAHLFSLRATEKEKLMIDAYYESIIERNDEKQLQILNELAVKYPKEKIVYYILGAYFENRDRHNESVDVLNKALILDPDYGAALNQIAYAYSGLGKYEKAIEYLKKYSVLNPKDANPFDSMADYYWKIGNIDLAIEYYLKAINIKSDFFDSMLKLSYIYAMKENYKETEKWNNRALEIAPSIGRKATFLWIKAFYNSWCGKTNIALNNLKKVRELSQLLNNKYVESGSDWLQAYILFDIGKLKLVNQYYLNFLDYIKEYSTSNTILFTATYKYLSALVNIKQNLTDSAKIKLSEIKSILQRITEGKNLIEYEYDLLNAEILLAENYTIKAITAFKNVTRQEVPTIGYPDIVGYNLPFMKDGLARAYQKAGQLDNAISEYERLTTYNPQGKDRYLIHPRYHYRLAVLYEEKGIKDKAIFQYKKFLELWEEADKNLPEPIDAKNRLRKLLEEKNL